MANVMQEGCLRASLLRSPPMSSRSHISLATCIVPMACS